MRGRSAGRVLGVGLLSAFATVVASPQDATKAFPQNYSMLFENSEVAVIRVHYGPHEKVGAHDHSSLSTVYVYLSDSGPVKFEHSEEKAFTVTRPPTVKGSYRVTPGRIERHTVENLGDASSDFLRVELKHIPLETLTNFRGPAPTGPVHNGEVVEYKVPSLEIDRIGCDRLSGCELKAAADPSLLITFTGATEKGAEKGASVAAADKLEAGAVRWLPAGQTISVQPDRIVPAHLLRLVFTQPAATKP